MLNRIILFVVIVAAFVAGNKSPKLNFGRDDGIHRGSNYDVGYDYCEYKDAYSYDEAAP